MKTISQIRSLFLISCIAIVFTAFQSANARPGEARPGKTQLGISVSFETFYHELAPYGRWISNRDFGYVWVPNVSRGFHPYMTEGHWVMTEYGNTWVSDYSWGWAPFHYGRWTFDDYYGWIWIPDTEWGPAWVAWRSGGGYYGWAPLGPRINISINIGRHIPNSYWTFVKYGYFNHPHVYRYCAPSPRVTNIIHHTTIINNTYVDNGRHTYYTGPDARDVERTTHKRVQVHQVRQVDRPGRTTVHNGSVNVYRPTVRKSSGSYESNAARGRSNLDNTRSNTTHSRTYSNSGSREQYSRSRQSIDRQDSRSTRSSSSRSTFENSRTNKASESRSGSNMRSNSASSRVNNNTQLQQSSRGSAPQRNSSRENVTSRSRQNSSIQRSPSSHTKPSGQSTRSGRGNSTYQRDQRSSSPAVKSRTSRSTERSTQSQNSRSRRSGNN